MTDFTTPHDPAPGVPPVYDDAQSVPTVPGADTPGSSAVSVSAASAQQPAAAPAQSAAPAPKRRWVWPVVVVVCVLIIVGGCGWVAWLGTGDLGVPVGDAIAVIPIDGVIAGTGSTGVITPQDFRDKLNQALDDETVKAIVLRVDSPGGTVAASEEIALYVKAADKPVVVSVGDVDASGAYMVSSQADRIIALPGSAVGSIGVITEIPNVAGLLDKLGVEFTVITAGTYKDAGSPYRSLTATEQALIQGSVNEVYGQFIDIVAEGRKMERSEVESLATGWAWNGTEAKKLGLVDQIGTFDDALEAAAKLGKIEGDYDTVTYDDAQFEDVFGSLVGLSRQLGDLNALGRSGAFAPGAVLAK
jgi:protease IV